MLNSSKSAVNPKLPVLTKKERKVLVGRTKAGLL